ncbi:class II D-tagatose-bisphosphate aldolase non-catalytic subunit [Alistipes communis]|uniref:class II D-tagatose-bisphosphate aldolase non-catalytic subunit n=1 Tax=Alistipes communis TaxID=2585118 RepID=UPI003AB5A575
MAKTEKLLQRIAELERETGIRRTLFAACPNSTAVIKAAFRAAKRNNAPIYFAATLNQIDCDGGYTGMRPDEFVKLVRMEAAAVNFDGIYIVAIDHGGPWLKDKQRTEKWSTEAAMDGVKRSFEAALLAGYDLIHVDPTVDINVPAGQTIDIRLVAARTVELIRHCETFRRAKGLPEISYEVGTEEVHGGLADERTFDTFIAELKAGLAREGLSDVWPCFIVGKVGTDLHTTLFDTEVARSLTAKVRPLGSYIKGTLHRRRKQSAGLPAVRHGRRQRRPGVHDERIRRIGRTGTYRTEAPGRRTYRHAFAHHRDTRTTGRSVGPLEEVAAAC